MEVLSKSKTNLGDKHISIVSRMLFILSNRQNPLGVTGPTKGIGFYPFEEDIDKHIHEALVTVSTGSTMSYFENPFVKSWLKAMDPRHRPIYRAKLGKLVRCINDVLAEEVRILSIRM